MLNRKTETKYLGQWITTGTAPTGVSPFPAYKFQNQLQALGNGGLWSTALPAQVQGLGDINRIGDKIEPVSHHVKMTIRLAPGYVSANESPSSLEGFTSVAQQVPLDCTAYIFYGYIKSMKTYQGSVATQNGSVLITAQSEAGTAYNKLLDNGDLTFTAFSGDPALAQLPLSSYVNMKVKKVHFRQGGGWINTAVGLSGQTPVANTAADNTLTRQLTLKFKPPSKLSYATSTDLYPNNYAPVFAVGYVYNDAMGFVGVPGGNPGAIEYVAQAQMWFKDHQ